MKPVINSDNIEYISKLSRIALNDKEIEKIAPQLSKILDYIEKLNELDTNHVEPTTHVIDIKNVLRRDKKEKSLDRKKVLKNAPDKENGYFKVPKVI